VRGFSLVLHDPKGSHYKNLEVKGLKNARKWTENQN
jgi:hypothetical protein